MQEKGAPENRAVYSVLPSLFRSVLGELKSGWRVAALLKVTMVIAKVAVVTRHLPAPVQPLLSLSTHTRDVFSSINLLSIIPIPPIESVSRVFTHVCVCVPLPFLWSLH